MVSTAPSEHMPRRTPQDHSSSRTGATATGWRRRPRPLGGAFSALSLLLPCRAAFPPPAPAPQRARRLRCSTRRAFPLSERLRRALQGAGYALGANFAPGSVPPPDLAAPDDEQGVSSSKPFSVMPAGGVALPNRAGVASRRALRHVAGACLPACCLSSSSTSINGSLHATHACSHLERLLHRAPLYQANVACGPGQQEFLNTISSQPLADTGIPAGGVKRACTVLRNSTAKADAPPAAAAAAQAQGPGGPPVVMMPGYGAGVGFWWR